MNQSTPEDIQGTVIIAPRDAPQQSTSLWGLFPQTASGWVALSVPLLLLAGMAAFLIWGR